MTTNVYYRFEYGFGKELELLIKVNELLSGDYLYTQKRDDYWRFRVFCGESSTHSTTLYKIVVIFFITK